MTAALIGAEPSYNGSFSVKPQAASRVRRAVRHIPLLLFGACAGLILFWGATHTAPSQPGGGTARTGELTTLSSQQFASQLRAQDVRAKALGPDALPASVTVVAVPPSPRP